MRHGGNTATLTAPATRLHVTQRDWGFEVALSSTPGIHHGRSRRTLVMDVTPWAAPTVSKEQTFTIGHIPRWLDEVTGPPEVVEPGSSHRLEVAARRVAAGTPLSNPTITATGPCSFAGTPSGVHGLTVGQLTFTGPGACELTYAIPLANGLGLADPDGMYAAAEVTRVVTVARYAQTVDLGPIPNQQAAPGRQVPLFMILGIGTGPLVDTVGPCTPGPTSQSAQYVEITGHGTCAVSVLRPESDTFLAAEDREFFTITPGQQQLALGEIPPAIVTGTEGRDIVLPIVAPAPGTPPQLSTATGACAPATDPLKVTLTGPGTCAVTVIRPDDGLFQATSASRTFSVVSGPLAIELTSPAPTGASVGGPAYQPTVGATDGPTPAAEIRASGACASGAGGVTFVRDGTCDLVAQTTSAPLLFASQSFPVFRSAQTITFDLPPLSPFVGTTYTPSATSSSGLPVTFSVEGACSIAGGTVTFAPYAVNGACLVRAAQAGNGDFAPAAPVTRMILVDKDTQSIGWDLPATGLVGQELTLTATGGGSGNPVTFAVEANGSCDIAENGKLNLTAGGACRVRADQAGSPTHHAAPRVTRELAVSRNGQTVTWESGKAPPAAGTVDQVFTLGATATSGLDPDVVVSGGCTWSPDTATLMLVARGTCTVEAVQAGDGFWAPAATEPVVLAVTGLGQELAWVTELPEESAHQSFHPLQATGGASSQPVLFRVVPSFEGSESLDCMIFQSAAYSFVLYRHTELTPTCTVEVSQAGDDRYEPAPPITATIELADPEPVGITSTVPANPMVGDLYLVSLSQNTQPQVTVEGACKVTFPDGFQHVRCTKGGTCTVTAFGDGPLAGQELTQVIEVAKAPYPMAFTSPFPADPRYRDPESTLEVTHLPSPTGTRVRPSRWCHMQVHGRARHLCSRGHRPGRRSAGHHHRLR